MSQKIMWFAVAVIAVILWRYFWPQPDIQVKALYQIQSSGLPLWTYQALVKFNPNITGTYQVSLDVDSNYDGIISTGERVLSGFVLSVVHGWDRLLPFVAEAIYNTGISKQLLVLHVVSDTGQTLSIKQRAKVSPYEVADRLRLDEVKNPDESMKGSIESVWINNGAVKITQKPATPSVKKGETPDISQQAAECAPAAAVNSLLRLVADYGNIKELQGQNPYQLIAELKWLMKRTSADGVTPDNFVSWKQAWISKRGLPITTKKVWNLWGEWTLDALQKALDNGGAAELRLRFTDSARRTVWWHMVTVIAVRQMSGQRYIDIHDPLSPKGTETYQLEWNKIIWYSMHNGPTYVSVWFTQVREQKIRPTTGVTKQIVKSSEIMPVIVYKGSRIPVANLRVDQWPECKEWLGQMPHYHPINTGGTVVDVSWSIIQDPDPDGCGFGFERDVPVEQYERP